jgi:hypothetical protein
LQLRLETLVSVMIVEVQKIVIEELSEPSADPIQRYWVKATICEEQVVSHFVDTSILHLPDVQREPSVQDSPQMLGDIADEEHCYKRNQHVGTPLANQVLPIKSHCRWYTPGAFFEPLRSQNSKPYHYAREHNTIEHELGKGHHFGCVSVTIHEAISSRELQTETVGQCESDGQSPDNQNVSGDT